MIVSAVLLAAPCHIKLSHHIIPASYEYSFSNFSVITTCHWCHGLWVQRSSDAERKSDIILCELETCLQGLVIIFGPDSSANGSSCIARLSSPSYFLSSSCCSSTKPKSLQHSSYNCLILTHESLVAWHIKYNLIPVLECMQYNRICRCNCSFFLFHWTWIY